MSHSARALVGALCLVLTLASCRSSSLTGAILRIQEGNYDVAVALLQKEIADNPDNPEAYFYLGVAYSYQDHVALAYEAFMTSVRLDPGDAGRLEKVEDNIRHNFARHFNAARALSSGGDYEAAAVEFDLATQADPRDAAGFYSLGGALSRLGETRAEEAIRALEKVIELLPPDDPRHGDALAAGGRLLADVGETGRAADWFRRLTAATPDRHAVVEGVAREFLERKEWRTAITFLEIAADARTITGVEDFELYYNTGVAWFNLRDTDAANARRAIDAYEKALALRPDEPQTLLNATVAHVFLSEWTDAVYFGEKYVASRPRDARAWRMLSRCYAEMGDMAKAREYLARAEQLQGEMD